MAPRRPKSGPNILKLDGVAPLMTDPPPTSSTTLYSSLPPRGHFRKGGGGEHPLKIQLPSPKGFIVKVIENI